MFEKTIENIGGRITVGYSHSLILWLIESNIPQNVVNVHDLPQRCLPLSHDIETTSKRRTTYQVPCRVYVKSLIALAWDKTRSIYVWMLIASASKLCRIIHSGQAARYCFRVRRMFVSNWVNFFWSENMCVRRTISMGIVAMRRASEIHHKLVLPRQVCMQFWLGICMLCGIYYVMR